LVAVADVQGVEATQLDLEFADMWPPIRRAIAMVASAFNAIEPRSCFGVIRLGPLLACSLGLPVVVGLDHRLYVIGATGFLHLGDRLAEEGGQVSRNGFCHVVIGQLH